MNLPNLETIIQENSTSKSRERGKDYHRQGCVYQLINRGNLLQGKVEGSQGNDYLVSIELSPTGVDSATCTCPYDWGGWCKHIIATLYYYQSYPGNIQQRPTLEQLLEQLNPLQIKQLIINLSEENPNLIEDIEDYVNRINPPKSRKNIDSRPRIDTKPIQNQVRRIIKDGIREIEEGYNEEDFVSEELADVIDSAQTLIEQGEVKNALLVLQAITETCINNWDDLDDYGIEAYDTAHVLDEAFTEAILSLDLDDADKVDLEVNLEFWQNEWSVSFAMSLAALKQGWDDLNLQKILQGEINNLGVWTTGEKPNYADDLTLIRLKILERQNRDQEYLYLAKAEGKVGQYLTYLVNLDRIDEAIVEAQQLITKMEEAWAIAKVLQLQGEPKKALAIACKGFSKEGNCQSQLGHWTAELAIELDNPEIALMALVKAFEAQPSLRDYQKIAQLAGADWLTLKADLLDYLRDENGWYVNYEKIKIFLEEKLIDEVIVIVDNNSSLLSYDVLEGVIPVNPDWVIKKAIPKAESIMDEGKSQSYQEAINWLSKARKAYYQADKVAQWQAYYQELKQIHGRKRKLMDLLKSLP